MASLTYATVGSNRLEEAKAFYDALLAVAGMAPLMEHRSGGRLYAKNGRLAFGVLGPFNGEPATPGNGTMIAFGCGDVAEVDALHAKALELGGQDEGAPGFRGPGLYFCYVRDLDGNKLCAYHIDPALARA